MAEGYVFEISGDVAKYAQAMSQIPGVTEKAAAQAALKASPQFIKLYSDAEKAADKSAKGASQAFGKSAQAIGTDAARLGAAFDSVIPGSGALVKDFGHLAQGAGVLGPEFAAIAAGGAAIAMALAAPIVTLGAVDLALVKLAFDAKDNLKALEGFKAIGSDFYPSIPASTLASFNALAATQDALSSIGDHLAVVLAAGVAPSVEKAADVAVGLALAADRVVEKWAVGKDLFTVLATNVLAGFAQALAFPMAPLIALGDGVGYLAKIAGVDLPESMKEGIASLDRLRDGKTTQALAESAVAFVENSSAAKSLGAALSGTASEGAAFIRVQERATEATKNAGKAAKEASDAQKQAMADGDKAMQDYNAQIKADVAGILQAQSQAAAGADAQRAAQKLLNEELGITETRVDKVAEAMGSLGDSYAKNKIDADHFEKSLETLAKARDAAAWDDFAAGFKTSLGQMSPAASKEFDDINKIVAEHISGQKTTWQDYGSSVSDIFGVIAESASKKMESLDPKKNRSAFMAAFQAQKAAGIAQATINTILAVSNALAIPIPPPGPEIAAAAAGVAGAVEIAKIAATPPPKFHTGTLYAAPSLASDEFSATLQKGEIVVDRNTASKPGNRETIAGMMAGKSTHSDDVAEGMEKSSLPGLLYRIAKAVERPAPQFSQSGRPGWRPSYAVS